MKLYKLLFENVNEDDTLKAILDMLKTNSSTAKYLKTFIDHPLLASVSNTSNKGMALAKYFYTQTKNEWNKILNNATSIQHLGGGSKGNAFNVKTKDGNYILKLELETPWDTRFSAKKRATTASTALFGEPKPKTSTPTALINPTDKTVRENKDASIGIAVPMIYDQGTMRFPNIEGGQEISWTLMEKFEIPTQKDQNKLNDLLDQITEDFYNGQSLEYVKNVNNLPANLKRHVKNLSSSLSLKDNWFEELVTHMWNLQQKGISDFHAGNIGLRRSGAQGTLVFFD
jgi:hypothetical protein